MDKPTSFEDTELLDHGYFHLGRRESEWDLAARNNPFYESRISGDNPEKKGD